MHDDRRPRVDSPSRSSSVRVDSGDGAGEPAAELGLLVGGGRGRWYGAC